MKQLFITAIFCTGILMAGKNARAQNSTAPAAKIASDENALKPTAESARTARLKQEEPTPPAVQALQTSASPNDKTASATAQTADVTKDIKSIEIKADTKKEQSTQNADRPKTSTIEPAKNTAPATKPMPRAAPPIEGN